MTTAWDCEAALRVVAQMQAVSDTIQHDDVFGEAAALLRAADAEIARLQAENDKLRDDMAGGSFFQEKDIDAMQDEIARLRAREADAERMAEALRERDGGVHDTDCKYWRPNRKSACNCGHKEVVAALAAWDASRGEGGR